MLYNMKKSAIIFLTSLILLLLVGRATFADERGKGNEKKNENGAQVTFQEDTKIVENKNKIMIKIKIDDKDNNGKDEHEDEDEDEDDNDDDDVTASPTPSPQVSITPTATPTETPTVTPTVTPTENPTITPTETPTVTPTGTQQQVFINAKIKGKFDVDQIVTFLENLINTIKGVLTSTNTI